MEKMMSGSRLAHSMSALPSAASAVGRMLHRTSMAQLTLTTSSTAITPSAPLDTTDENGFVLLQPEPKPSRITAVARYDFDGFGGQLSFRRGDEIILVDYPPSSSSARQQTPYAPSSSATATSWCVGKRAMDGVMGIVYLPALKLPTSGPAGAGASSSTSPSMPAAIASPTGPRRGRLFIVDRSVKEVEEEKDKGYDRYGNAVADEDDEELSGGGRSKTRRRTRGESYGPQLVGFVIVLLALLFVLDFFGEAGWGLVMLGFLPRLASLFDRHVVHRRLL
jgi:hypothetical protein